jgi:succinate-semialdehyde dehydrogenase/glutarate-semialdehyde dehydrogenase
MGLAETKEGIAAAEKALPEWSKTTAKVSANQMFISQNIGMQLLTISLQHRHDILMKLFALMQEHQDDLSRLIVRPCHFLSTSPA